MYVRKEGRLSLYDKSNVPLLNLPRSVITMRWQNDKTIKDKDFHLRDYDYAFKSKSL